MKIMCDCVFILAELGISNALSKRITASKLEISKEKIDKPIQTEEKFEIQYDASQKLFTVLWLNRFLY